MRALRVCLFPVLLLLAEVQADSFLCTGDKATGFRSSDAGKQWSVRVFDASTNQYIIKKHTDVMGRIPRIIARSGEEEPMIFCDDDVGGEDTLLTCDDVTTQFYFSMKTMRYMLVHADGSAVESEQESIGMPFIETGKCTPR